MQSPDEQFRFKETNRLIESQMGEVGALLEIGCGEGHQSLELLKVCKELYGIDVSARAVRRAKQRCPRGTFDTGDLYTCGLVHAASRFDLVVACEVLYYMANIPAAIDRLSQRGRWCLVTYHDLQSSRLDPYFAAMAGVQSAHFQHGRTAWQVRWWENKARFADIQGNG
jgi:cyclopropane fatty-acyl-phospholipid synthase-like methyltransferase